MIGPRWKKVLADLWSNKTRTILVSLSIAVGVFAVGMIAESRERMMRGLSEDYLKSDPFSGVVTTSEPFDEEMLETIRKIDGVAEADANQSVSARLKIGPDRWKSIDLTAIRDFDDIRVGKMWHMRGTWPPDDHEMAIERSALNSTIGHALEFQQTYIIETLDQKRRRIPLTGVVHDLNLPPALFTDTYTAYITEETLEWLGKESRQYTGVLFRVGKEHFFDRDYIMVVAKEIRDKIESNGIEVEEIFIPPDPGVSPVASFGLEPIILILSVVGVLAVFLSGFLVTNTISGLMAQQIRLIGIMKSIGARNAQIILMYLVLVIFFGVIALLVALPLAHIAAGFFSRFFAALFNFDAPNYGIIPSVFAMELFVSLVVPIIASIYSLIQGARITVRAALDTTGSAGVYGTHIIDRIINQIRGLPRPLLLSFRNTVRRKGRLVLTLTTLTIAGGTFIAVFSVQESVRLSLEETFSSLIRYDVIVNFDRDYRMKKIEQEASNVPGVVHVESWGNVTTRRLRPDDSESEIVFFMAPPEDSDLIRPEIIKGRWLLPDDQNAVVVSSGLTKEEEDVQVRDMITFKHRGRETEWQVVGIGKGFGTEMFAYANLPFFEREMRIAGEANNVRVLTTHHDAAFQAEVQDAMERHFRGVGLRVRSSSTSSAEFQQNVDTFNIIIYCLLIMAILTAIVGGLGLAGTMSMNVLERTREIGVMRAIGASDFSVLQVVLTEGIMIGLISWLLGVMIAYPISKILSDNVGILFTGTPFSYAYSFNGALMWLALSLSLATLASFLPAWNASRLTVRDVLAYE